jgi:acetylcholinesterase
MSLQDITDQQPLFDQLVADTGCTGSADLIACLRAVPFNALMAAVNKSPSDLSFSTRLRWQPSVDGHFIVRNPYVSILKGLYAKVRLKFLYITSFRHMKLRLLSDRSLWLPVTAMTRERM